MSLLMQALGQETTEQARPREHAEFVLDPSTAALGESQQEVATTEHRFGARTLFVAAERGGGPRRRSLAIAAAGLLCAAAVGGYLSSRVVATPAAPSPRTQPLPPPHTAPVPRPSPPAGEVLRRPRPPVTDEERAPKLAERIEWVPLPNHAELQVTRRERAPQVGSLLSEAYGAYLRGEPQTARAAYRQALAADPENRQALLGLAAVAARSGETAEARELYLRRLERDPADPLALAGLLRLDRPTDLPPRERRLKALLARHPDVAPLHILLGDLYVLAQRWPEAREAYARALALETRAGGGQGQNPDLAFNLAVTLEHLGRRGEALVHYRAALDWAKARTPAFDPDVAEARARALAGA